MNVVKVTFTRDHAGYNSQEQAAFSVEEAIALVAKDVAVFSDLADLEANREAVEVAKRSRPAAWVHPMVKVDPRRWG